MEKGFWLIALDDISATVSFVSQNSGQYHVTTVGQPQDWLATNPDTIVKAVDASLSATAELSGLATTDEPSVAAFILPPFWVGVDGKISPNYLKLVESVCKELKLKPLGFISNDEAVTEAANSADSFPASFIFVYLNRQLLTLSLVYLGKVKSRLSRVVSGDFDPSIIESALADFHSDSTLPPQIILAGQINDQIIQLVKNYGWIGKKNIETFLHYPSVSIYTPEQLASIYCQVVSRQFTPSSQSIPIDSEADDVVDVELEVENDTNSHTETENLSLPDEVEATDLGFIASSDNISPVVEPPPSLQKTNKFNLKLPKISLPKLPKIKVRLRLSVWILPLIFALSLTGVLFFSRAKVSLLLTPYNFSQTTEVDLNSIASKKTFEINSTVAVKTTGQKTVGSPAKGEVIIFNKLEKSQTIPKSTVLVTDNNLKYELTSTVQLAPSSTNYDSGTIIMGQTKTLVSSLEIGPDYNISKDTKLTFKDGVFSTLAAKTNQNFTGGTKRQASAVSAEDKSTLEQKVKSDIAISIDSRLNQDVKTISDSLSETIDIKRNRIEYSREVGEEAEEVTATSNNTVSVYYFTAEQKIKAINAYLSSTAGFTDSIINPTAFKFTFVPSSTDKSRGRLTISGSAIPKTNTSQLQKSLSGKSQKQAFNIIRKIAPRTYNYKITTNLPFFDNFNPLPFFSKNITIESK